MNNYKISFITCVNDKEAYKECIRYINNLNVPEKYEIDIISIEDAENITSAYNEAIKSTDAKYKIYLHQDTFIINKNFINDMLNIFKKDEQIGMVGLIGCKTIPVSGIWWQSKDKYGKIYENHKEDMKLLNFKEVLNEYEEVQAIDGLIMVTQHDVKWRQDIFDGWHFYDVSQSVEFNLAGYKIVVPKQEEAWCIHDCGIVETKNNYDIYRRKFLSEYCERIFPLVSVLIPTYNRPKYFELALKSVLNQTYKNIEIIIGDDSTNNETEMIVVKKYLKKYSNITYYHNEKNLGQFDNDLKLMDFAKGKYVNFLMDDDLFEDNKIEKMMNYFINDVDKEISLVTSHRAKIDSDGKVSGIYGKTDELFKNDIIINGIQLVNFILKTNFNCIGEPTTVLFRKDKLKERFGVYNTRKYGCNVDRVTWSNLLINGKAVFINEVLSYFRIHDNQQLASDKMKLLGALDYAHEILAARKKGFLLKNEEFAKALSCCLKYNNKIIDYFDGKSKEEEKIYEISELKEKCEIIKSNLNKILDIKKGDINESSNKLPLISILIPTYNQTKYLKEALESAINQTYPNIEIIIGDDSTTDEVEKFVEEYLNRYENISYYRNQREEMDYGISNIENLFKKSNGEYIAYLLHDDVFHKEKVEKMIRYFLDEPNVTLVTSYRKLIDSYGNILKDLNFNIPLFETDTKIGGMEMCKFIISNTFNAIGELSTAMFKKKDIEGKILEYNNKLIRCNGDMTLWIKLLEKGDLIYISECLNYFRQHENQNTNNKEIQLYGVLDSINMVEEFYKRQLVVDKIQRKKDIIGSFCRHMYILGIWDEIKDYDSKVELVSKFKEFLQNLIEY